MFPAFLRVASREMLVYLLLNEQRDAGISLCCLIRQSFGYGSTGNINSDIMADVAKVRRVDTKVYHCPYEEDPRQGQQSCKSGIIGKEAAQKHLYDHEIETEFYLRRIFKLGGTNGPLSTVEKVKGRPVDDQHDCPICNFSLPPDREWTAEL